LCSSSEYLLTFYLDVVGSLYLNLEVYLAVFAICLISVKNCETSGCSN
jgi:hypothetical protein